MIVAKRRAGQGGGRSEEAVGMEAGGTRRVGRVTWAGRGWAGQGDGLFWVVVLVGGRFVVHCGRSWGKGGWTRKRAGRGGGRDEEARGMRRAGRGDGLWLVGRCSGWAVGDALWVVVRKRRAGRRGGRDEEAGGTRRRAGQGGGRRRAGRGDGQWFVGRCGGWAAGGALWVVVGKRRAGRGLG